MASATYLTSTLLMGVLLVAVVVWMLSAREWHHYVPTAVGAPAGGDAFFAVSRAVRSPVTWTVSFLVFAFAAVFGGLAFVGSDLVPVGDSGLAGMGMAAIAAVLFVIYLFAGSYHLAKSRGVGDAAATAAGASVVALVLALAVFVKLFAGL